MAAAAIARRQRRPRPDCRPHRHCRRVCCAQHVASTRSDAVTHSGPTRRRTSTLFPCSLAGERKGRLSRAPTLRWVKIGSHAARPCSTRLTHQPAPTINFETEFNSNTPRRRAAPPNAEYRQTDCAFARHKRTKLYTRNRVAAMSRRPRSRSALTPRGTRAHPHTQHTEDARERRSTRHHLC